MLRRDSIWWSQQEFKDVSSYTTSRSPVWLQEAGQSLFRNLMTSHLCERLGRLNKGRLVNKVVDLACGPGDWTLRYLNLAQRVVGVDINREFIHAARRSAAGLEDPTRAEFQHMNIVAYDDYQDADLVCMGACLQCMQDNDVAALLQKQKDALQPGAWIYVRTNVAKKSVGSYTTTAGSYRSQRAYERLFTNHGLQIVDGFTCFSVIATQAMRDLTGLQSFAAAHRLASPIWFFPHLTRQLWSKSYRYNWLLVKR